MNSEATFRFSGQDFLSQFTVWLYVLGAGGLSLAFLGWDRSGLYAAFGSFAIALLVVVGLCGAIEVSPSSVVMTKRWFFIPYRRYSAKIIEDVWFGGDWGDSEGASGVVVQLAGKEIHLGSSKSMHHLHAALFPFRARHVP